MEITRGIRVGKLCFKCGSSNQSPDMNPTIIKTINEVIPNSKNIF